MDPPLTRDRYTEDDFDSLGFHDCYVYGFKWDSNHFSLLFDIDYIVKWAEPIAADQRFQFWICPAELCFKNIADATRNSIGRDSPLNAGLMNFSG